MQSSLVELMNDNEMEAMRLESLKDMEDQPPPGLGERAPDGKPAGMAPAVPVPSKPKPSTPPGFNVDRYGQEAKHCPL